MKKNLLFSFFLLAALNGFSQSFEAHSQDYQPQNGARKISPQTSFLLMDLANIQNLSTLGKGTQKELMDKYFLKKKDGKFYVNSFLYVGKHFSKASFKEYGVLPGQKVGNFYTALIPVAKIKSFSNALGVKYIQIGKRVMPQLDSARYLTNVDSVHYGRSPLTRSYYGRGILIGDVDVGLDYTHPNFYDTTGQSGYRIVQVWEQRDTVGPAPQGFNYGKLLATQQDILAAKRDMVNQTHASHVGGIALGAGGGQSLKYMGVAPKSDFVYCGTTLADADVMDGVMYIMNYANFVHKPCVVNLSLGSQVGPHDGTSIFDQMVDSLVGPGRLIVGSAGNDGSKRLYLGKDYSGQDTVLKTFVDFTSSNHGNDGDAYVDIWGQPGNSFSVKIYVYNVQTNTALDSTVFYPSNVDTSYQITLLDNAAISDTCFIDIATGISPLNGKPRIQFEVDNSQQGNHHIYPMVEIRANHTATKMWGYYATFSDKSKFSPFQSGSTDHTVSEVGGTANGIITVGSYESKKYWTDLKNHTHHSNGTPGHISSFSSRGPTADGRVKPNIAAPGQVLVSSVNSFNPGYHHNDYRVVYQIQYGSDKWYYAIMQGTSMAAPMVSGILALWMEMYPDLTPQQVKELFQHTAIRDSITGNITAPGSNTWGLGKVNAWVNVDDLLPPQPVLSPDTVIICGNASTTLSAPSGYTAYEWSNGGTTRTIRVDTPGVYRVKVQNNRGYHSPWSNPIYVEQQPLPPAPTITQIGDTLYSSRPTGNQWYRDNQPIPGAIQPQYVITRGGYYKVVVSIDNMDCSSASNVLDTYPKTGISHVNTPLGLVIYPNPVHKVLRVKANQSFGRITYAVYDAQGRLLQTSSFGHFAEHEVKTINLKTLPAGSYAITFKSRKGKQSFNITIMK